MATVASRATADCGAAMAAVRSTSTCQATTVEAGLVVLSGLVVELGFLLRHAGQLLLNCLTL
eukprot:CAMPEP_0197620304 /NCGR_PEP_ID=MMETSP1338-20131121/1159_1 /TAXON_ID=43686 ORGANISM="Pelagodinium beii, Strain RCC1491" /NCGR_SAMPLE_ID=MMETSP1338 /ASSEMBLY_ACC=CAM_ASM_000754 /LENGTH=61 /DNA_ID=CAMNT_0043189453 /DNA_START=170 /DNA_END=355 /DNA_ORIENTATION=+